MKLLYYEDITPQDYEPPGFVRAESDTFSFKGKPITINAGEVSTPHHTLKLKIRTDNSQFEDFVPTQEDVVNNLRKDLKRKLTSFEPMDFEVTETQDSVFVSIPKVEKKLKASKTDKNIRVDQRL
jgi:hypothetical protein